MPTAPNTIEGTIDQAPAGWADANLNGIPTFDDPFRDVQANGFMADGTDTFWSAMQQSAQETVSYVAPEIKFDFDNGASDLGMRNSHNLAEQGLAGDSSMADKARESEDSVLKRATDTAKSLFDDAKGYYKNGMSDQEKGFMWQFLKGAFSYKTTKAAAKAQTMNAEANMMAAQTQQRALDNKIAQQGSAGAAWGKVNKPGLINFAPPKITPIQTRIGG